LRAGASVARGEGALLARSPLSRLPDRALRWGLSGLAAGVLILIGYFFVRLIGQSSTAFGHVGLFNFFFRNHWEVGQLQQGAVCAGGGGHCTFGAWALVLGTLITSAIALVIGVPIAVATALYLTELCPRRARAPLSMLVDLLAAVPSVVYGLWGVFVLIPALKGFQQSLANTFSFLPFVGGPVAGPSYFIAGLILAIMILPIVCAIAREVISTVPVEHKEAALALGATRWEMIRMAVLPYSRAGITGGAMLGLGRAIGETIAVVLVIGNSPTLGHAIFQQGYTLAAVIANEFGEAAATPVHKSALFAAGLVLFVLTLLVNIVARRFVVRRPLGRRGAAGVLAAEVEASTLGAAGAGSAVVAAAQRAAAATARPTAAVTKGPVIREPPPTTVSVTQGRGGAGVGVLHQGVLPEISPWRRRTDQIMRGLLATATAIALVPLVLVVYYLFHRGLSAWSGTFFTTDPNGNFFGYHGGVRSAILGTLEIVALATAIAVPIGIGVALYLTEYGKDSRFANVVRYFVDVMTGVPSIVFGLFIYIVLVVGNLGGGFAGWKGSIALSLLMLPIVIRSSEVVLLLVPNSLREAALALGAPRWRVVTRIVLPTSLTGLITGALLAIARGAGETAPLLFTAFGAQVLSGNLGSPMNALPLQIFNDLQSPRSDLVSRAWGAALTLVLMILVLNLMARFASRRSRLA
jgi:phosphate ABC transporter permease protein PstC/phosphate ABC transporter permease subunit PstA